MRIFQGTTDAVEAVGVKGVCTWRCESVMIVQTCNQTVSNRRLTVGALQNGTKENWIWKRIRRGSFLKSGSYVKVETVDTNTYMWIMWKYSTHLWNKVGVNWGKEEDMWTSGHWNFWKEGGFGRKVRELIFNRRRNGFSVEQDAVRLHVV